MKENMNILVFPCGTEVGLEIGRSFVGVKNITIFGANSANDHGRFLYANYIGDLPYINEESFIESICKVIIEYGIKYIIPAHDEAVLILKNNEQIIGAKVVAPRLELCQLARSKRKTYEELIHCVSVPKIFERGDLGIDTVFPVFIKPDVGQGSKGAYLVSSVKELNEKLSSTDEDYVICEYLPGEEYTVDCFSDKDGVLKSANPRIRNRVLNGISVNTTNVCSDVEEYCKFANQINNRLNVVGAWFFQVKRNGDGELVLLEISMRISGSMALHRVTGVNFSELSLYVAMGMDVEVMQNQFAIEMDRALDNKYILDFDYKHIYMDFDDCVLIDGRVNIQAVSLIYKSHNEGRRVTLLTRHDGDVSQILEKYRLKNLFDEVVHILNGDEKSKYIKDKNSIFIDDSYRERKSVMETLNIPVFSVDSIECLL